MSKTTKNVAMFVLMGYGAQELAATYKDPGDTKRDSIPVVSITVLATGGAYYHSQDAITDAEYKAPRADVFSKYAF